MNTYNIIALRRYFNQFRHPFYKTVKTQTYYQLMGYVHALVMNDLLDNIVADKIRERALELYSKNN